MSFRNDDQLMMDYGKRGDTAAFDILYQRYRKPLFGFIRQQLAEAPANEVFQECWEAIIAQASGYHPSGSFRSFIYTICRRRISDYWRKQIPHEQHHDDDSEINSQSSGAPNPEQIQLQQATESIILMCVGKLPKKQQDVFRLKQAGLAVDEISQQLHVSFETIKSRIRASYQQLRICWERHHD
ncbi:sigma-70 family RNA polymerase sigma factor [Echinimonas agarilytica]|uniref:Sigma-70 family RNA polymerase sigma factor n=1 Tax=Echinimonas agarilytica TaxID=1215918 RepID=A0AA42B7S5_9GAMM|nr:sigma-70 family RNA polymerase sigma factor [Echinimonas agarilytica]MCM2680049.1 sigma-70 family RNA polymerase sigma factor [Echinimonas agarilytica]